MSVQRKTLNLSYGELLAGSPRDLTDAVTILVEAQRYDLVQGEFSAGLVKGALQLRSGSSSLKRVAVDVWLVSKYTKREQKSKK